MLMYETTNAMGNSEQHIMGMEVSSNFGIGNSLKELETNTEASDFIADNYTRLIEEARKMNVRPGLEEDLVHAVWLSIKTGETYKGGYDMHLGSGDGIISLERFVLGRMKGYSKNEKFRKGAMGHEVSATPFTLDCERDNYNSNDAFQVRYAQASTYDDIEIAETGADIQSLLSLCQEFEEHGRFNVVSFFKNLDNIMSLGVDSSVFDAIKECVQTHDEFAEAFKALIEYRKDNVVHFNHALHNMSRMVTC